MGEKNLAIFDRANNVPPSSFFGSTNIPDLGSRSRFSPNANFDVTGGNV